MIRLSALLVLAALPAAFASPALAGPAHVHGKGDLAVVVAGDTLTLTLEIPLDALVGFERAPRNEREKAAWQAMEQILGDPAALFQPTAEAACTPAAKTVHLPFGTGGQAAADDHGDADAEYVFKCARPAALKGFATTIFQRFPRLYRLDVKRSGPSGQGAARLAPKLPSLAW